MKAKILTPNGKEKSTIDLPAVFSAPIREDIVAKVLEAKKSAQPYAPALNAGKQHSAKGQLVHRRHVWKSQYGRGISRVARKILTRRGSQFNWIGAFAPNTRGGMRAHPPRVTSIINTKKINKKEMQIAFSSAISATASKKEIERRYARINKFDKDVPLIVDSKFTSLKAKDILSNLKKILGEKLFEIGMKDKKIRRGKGKLRGRKYKRSAGGLLVIGKDEKLKTNLIDVKNIKNLGIEDLAKGGLGRLTIYTEQAIKDLKEEK